MHSPVPIIATVEAELTIDPCKDLFLTHALWGQLSSTWSAATSDWHDAGFSGPRVCPLAVHNVKSDLWRVIDFNNSSQDFYITSNGFRNRALFYLFVLWMAHKAQIVLKKPLSITHPPFFTQTGSSVSPLLIPPYLHIQSVFFFGLFAASLHLASRGDFSIPMHAVPLSAGRCPFAPVPTWQGEEGTKGVLLLSASLSLFCLSVFCSGFHSQRGKD